MAALRARRRSGGEKPAAASGEEKDDAEAATQKGREALRELLFLLGLFLGGLAVALCPHSLPATDAAHRERNILISNARGVVDEIVNHPLRV